MSCIDFNSDVLSKASAHSAQRPGGGLGIAEEGKDEHELFTCHMIVFMPLTNPNSSRTVRILPSFVPSASWPILHDNARRLIF